MKLRFSNFFSNVPPKNDRTLQSTTNWNEGKSKHKRADTWGHRKRHFNILQTEWISMRFSTGSYNIQVKGIRSCRQDLKVVPKKYNRLSVRWILVQENRKDPWIRITRQGILVFFDNSGWLNTMIRSCARYHWL